MAERSNDMILASAVIVSDGLLCWPLSPQFSLGAMLAPLSQPRCPVPAARGCHLEPGRRRRVSMSKVGGQGGGFSQDRHSPADARSSGATWSIASNSAEVCGGSSCETPGFAHTDNTDNCLRRRSTSAHSTGLMGHARVSTSLVFGRRGEGCECDSPMLQLSLTQRSKCFVQCVCLQVRRGRVWLDAADATGRICSHV